MSIDKVKQAAGEKLDAALEGVCDEATFCDFLQALAQDWFQEREIEKETPSRPHSSGALGWENGTIGDFLGAAAVGLHALSDEVNIWKRAALIIYLGKIYE